ncbi:hypothetical protein [Paenibacillus sp. IITD108]|uniref:hypothetical protein n=1 Tax=Paenibacillus sp. IITD108 TaxID=3116649 RepID=UPI002F3FEBF9
MHYGTWISEDNKLQIVLLKTDDVEEMGKIVRVIPHANSVVIDRYVTTETFKYVDDMMQFMDEKRLQEKVRSNYYFIVRAYEFTEKDRLKLYYEDYFSNA